jgi:broad specificity phosphatase PhoE
MENSKIQVDWMRHGKTISNHIRDTEGFLGFFKQAVIGEDLHASGVAQTRNMATNDKINLNSYDYIFCSLLPRSIETALILLHSATCISKKIYVIPYLNEMRPWWACGMDWVNCPKESLKELKEHVHKFAREHGIPKTECKMMICYDFIENMWNTAIRHQSSPKDFYQFLFTHFEPRNDLKILVVSHSWYMYYHFGLPLRQFCKISNNAILRETVSETRESIQFIYDPELSEEDNEHLFMQHLV